MQQKTFHFSTFHFSLYFTLSRRVDIIRFKTKRYSQPPVDQQENSPGNSKYDGVGYHHRDQCPYTRIFHITLTEDHYKWEVRQ